MNLIYQHQLFLELASSLLLEWDKEEEEISGTSLSAPSKETKFIISSFFNNVATKARDQNIELTHSVNTSNIILSSYLNIINTHSLLPLLYFIEIFNRHQHVLCNNQKLKLQVRENNIHKHSFNED